MPTRENFHFSAREKKIPTREKIFERVREKSGLPVKNVKNACVKMILHPWKKWQKVPKMAFTHTFGFHGEKKNTGKGVFLSIPSFLSSKAVRMYGA